MHEYFLYYFSFNSLKSSPKKRIIRIKTSIKSSQISQFRLIHGSSQIENASIFQLESIQVN